MMLAQLFALDAYGRQRIVTETVLDNATDEKHDWCFRASEEDEKLLMPIWTASSR